MLEEKILILARETGAKLELNDVSIENLIPDSIDDNVDVDDFLKNYLILTINF